MAFGRTANSLVTNDTNGLGDIFVRDRGASADDDPGDCNGDGERNITDLGMILADFGGPSACDTNGDGVIDITDLGTLLAVFGDPCPS